jgi:hypothetical protein
MKTASRLFKAPLHFLTTDRRHRRRTDRAALRSELRRLPARLRSSTREECSSSYSVSTFLAHQPEFFLALVGDDRRRLARFFRRNSDVSCGGCKMQSCRSSEESCFSGNSGLVLPFDPMSGGRWAPVSAERIRHGRLSWRRNGAGCDADHMQPLCSYA